MTYLEKLFAALDADPHRVALIDADNGTSVTAAEFTALTARLAEALRRTTGLARGSVVAIVAPATVEGLAVRYAAALLGCVTVYCPDANTPQRLTVFLERINADLLIVFPEAADFGPAVSQVVSVGQVAGIATDLLTVEVGTTTLTHTAVRPTDVCVLVATGGTTGVSKASRRNWAGYTTMADLGATPGRRQLIVTPLAYIAQIIADGVLIGGGTVLLHRRFEAEQVLRSLGRHQITHVTLVEPHLVELVDSAALDGADLSTVVAINHIGADAAASLRARLLARLGRPILVNPYGASEIGMVSALAPPDYSLADPELLGTSGRPAASVEVRVVSGEVQVRSAAQALGYSVAPPVSGLRTDGWFATGDLGELDAQGYLHIRGRAEDLREVCGQPVLPRDLQEAFCALPGVRYAVAVPGSDGFGLALVIDAGVVVDDLLNAVRTNAGAHLVPVATAVVDRMPRTEQGKPDRGALVRLLFG
ncbi:AMP-binding protein [soil metagenome]